MSDLSYPGVYVREENNLYLAVNESDTAVPAFFCTSAEFQDVADDAENSPKEYKKIGSWLEVARDKANNARTQKAIDGSGILRSLQSYFENGGGPCYVLNGNTLPIANHIKKLYDVTLLVEAGTASAAVIRTFCEQNKSVFGILDAPEATAESANATDTNAPKTTKSKQGASETATGATDSSAHCAAYMPMLLRGQVRIPASAVMAGVYCRIDRERGVWKAPANVAIWGGLTVSEHISKEQIGQLMDGAKPTVNVIRADSGQAPVVWGARTNVSDLTDEFKYVPVRRLFNAVERDIKAAMSVAVFEPNSAATWERVRAAIDNYLFALWKQGGLMGDMPEEAYLVQVGLGVTMTAADITAGKMIVKVALAPSHPAEFVILEFSQKMGGA